MDGMSADELVATYLRALSSGDVDLAVSLFTDDAVGHSLLYGATEPGTFYPRLFADTSAAHLTLLATMQGHDQQGATMISFFFHFDWHRPQEPRRPLTSLTRASGP